MQVSKCCYGDMTTQIGIIQNLETLFYVDHDLYALGFTCAVIRDLYTEMSLLFQYLYVNFLPFPLMSILNVHDDFSAFCNSSNYLLFSNKCQCSGKFDVVLVTYLGTIVLYSGSSLIRPPQGKVGTWSSNRGGLS